MLAGKKLKHLNCPILFLELLERLFYIFFEGFIIFLDCQLEQIDEILEFSFKRKPGIEAVLFLFELGKDLFGSFAVIPKIGKSGFFF